MARLDAFARAQAALDAALLPAGLEATAAFALGWYNAAVPAHLQLPSPLRGEGADAACLLIGSAKPMWKAFAAALRDGSAKVDAADPLDEWVERSVLAACRASEKAAGLPDGSSHVYFAHHTAPGKLVAMQKLAALSGAYYLDDDAHLVIHPEYGQWCALRAVVLYAIPRSDAALPARPPPPLDRSPLGSDHAPTVRRLFAEAVASPSDSQRWLALRDGLSPGHAARYDGALALPPRRAGGAFPARVGPTMT